MPVDAVIAEIVSEGRRALDVRRVILFGSRSRGDARANSDIDLAFEHQSADEQWAAFVNTMAEEAPTLLTLDLVDLRNAESALQKKVLAEGKVVYG